MALALEAQTLPVRTPRSQPTPTREQLPAFPFNPPVLASRLSRLLISLLPHLSTWARKLRFLTSRHPGRPAFSPLALFLSRGLVLLLLHLIYLTREPTPSLFPHTSLPPANLWLRRSRSQHRIRCATVAHTPPCTCSLSRRETNCACAQAYEIVWLVRISHAQVGSRYARLAHPPSPAANTRSPLEQTQQPRDRSTAPTPSSPPAFCAHPL